MRTRDESEWQLLMAGLAADPNQQVAGGVRKLLTTWADLAEGHLPHTNAAEALRRTLIQVEMEMGYVPTRFIGMALVLLYNHWDFGAEPDTLYNDLTPIEQHLFDDEAVIKLVQLQEQAREES